MPGSPSGAAYQRFAGNSHVAATPELRLPRTSIFEKGACEKAFTSDGRA
jgi:hypothetical protein